MSVFLFIVIALCIISHKYNFVFFIFFNSLQPNFWVGSISSEITQINYFSDERFGILGAGEYALSKVLLVDGSSENIYLSIYLYILIYSFPTDDKELSSNLR